MSWRVSIDQGRCMGTGLCVGTRPDRFVLDANRARPAQAEVEPDDELLDIAETCPTEAIMIHTADGELLAPGE